MKQVSVGSKVRLRHCLRRGARFVVDMTHANSDFALVHPAECRSFVPVSKYMEVRLSDLVNA